MAPAVTVIQQDADHEFPTVVNPAKLASLVDSKSTIKPSPQLAETNSTLNATLNTLSAPLVLLPSSPLLQHPHFDTAISTGTEFPRGSVQLTGLLNSPDSDTLLRDLAALISQRGVVFFRAQHINVSQQQELVQRLGELSGKPEANKLHIHPYTPEDSKLGDSIFPITSGEREKFKPDLALAGLPKFVRKEFDPERRASSLWVCLF